LQTRRRGGADPYFGAFRSHKRIGGRDRAARHRIDAREDAARVVAMKPVSGLQIELGGHPGASDDADAGAQHHIARAATILGPCVSDIEGEEIAARARFGAQPIVPRHRILRIHGETVLDDPVLPGHGGNKRAVFRGLVDPYAGLGIEETVVDAVVTELEP
jgi:hypothetical protein